VFVARYYLHEFCLVYPNEKTIKIFTLQNGKYIKYLDATDEIVPFELQNFQKYSFDLDFSKSWAL